MGLYCSEKRPLHCYASGRSDDWEAICLDYDIAVHGSNSAQVNALLGEAIKTYIEDAEKQSRKDRDRLLNRRVPFYVPLRYLGSYILHALRQRNGDGEAHAYDVPCPA
jgi:hypothetical protein